LRGVEDYELSDPKALEEIREHRRRLLMENRTSAVAFGLNLDRINRDLEEEISIVEAALSKFQDQGSGKPS
jgi:hypothetical protein